MINQVLILSNPTILCLQKNIIIARLYFSSFASKICKLSIFLFKFSNRSLAPIFGVQKSVEQEIKLVWPRMMVSRGELKLSDFHKNYQIQNHLKDYIRFCRNMTGRESIPPKDIVSLKLAQTKKNNVSLSSLEVYIMLTET